MVIAAAIGNALEFYDIIVFGFFAQAIGSAFFPSADPAIAQMQAWGVFGTAFVARPIGAYVLGRYADRIGRRASMTLSIALMTAGTGLLAFMPRYDAIGILAPIGILLARLLQGFSAGGEFGGSTAFMIEHAPQSRHGFFASFQFTSQAVSNILACAIALLVTGVMSKEAFAAWGFRIPFVIGMLIGPVGLYLRRGVDETPEFLASRKSSLPLGVLSARDWIKVALASGIVAMGTVGTYINIYLPSFAQGTLHLPPSTGYWVSLVSAVVSFFVTPVMAGISDRGARWHWPAVWAVITVLLAVPLVGWGVHDPGMTKLMIGIGALTALRAAYSAPMPAMLGEMFPVQVRALGMSLGYTIGVAVLGGFTPYLCSWAVNWSGNVSAPGYVLAAAGVLSLAALWGSVRQQTTN